MHGGGGREKMYDNIQCTKCIMVFENKPGVPNEEKLEQCLLRTNQQLGMSNIVGKC